MLYTVRPVERYRKGSSVSTVTKFVMKLSLSPRLNDSRLCQHVRAGNSQNYPRNEILSTGCETFRVTGSFVFSQSLSAGAEFIPQSANVIVKLKSRAVAVRLNVNSTCRPLLCLKLNLKNQSSLSGKLYTCIGRIVCNDLCLLRAGISKLRPVPHTETKLIKLNHIPTHHPSMK